MFLSDRKRQRYSVYSDMKNASVLASHHILPHSYNMIDNKVGFILVDLLLLTMAEKYFVILLLLLLLLAQSLPSSHCKKLPKVSLGYF